MKLKRKTLMTIGSIIGITAVGAGVATTFTSCSAADIADNTKAEIDDDYELNQAKYDFTEFASMIESSRSDGYIVNEHNGVTRNQIMNANEVKQFFDKLEAAVNDGLSGSKTTFH
jgi:ATP:corrinoid adenosyltransferase